MSAPRMSKFLKQLEENLYNLGAGKAQRKWFGDDSNGYAAALYNFTDSSAPTTTDKAFVIRMKTNEVAGLTWPNGMRTQSHAAGQYLDGNALVEVYFESPASFTSAHAKFVQEVIHVLRGQNGAVCRVSFTAAATLPTLNGVDGASSDVLGTELAVFLPYGRTIAGGSVP